MIKVPLLRHQRYSPSPLTLPLQNQRQNVPEKTCLDTAPVTGRLSIHQDGVALRHILYV
jgi:hypothetical protein